MSIDEKKSGQKDSRPNFSQKSESQKVNTMNPSTAKVEDARTAGREKLAPKKDVAMGDARRDQKI